MVALATTVWKQRDRISHKTLRVTHYHKIKTKIGFSVSRSSECKLITKLVMIECANQITITLVSINQNI